MNLKRIRLAGFKSFADETIIETGIGITAIVGPNGCGKSNILDAVRWVLGEKSGKALRGKSMEDVIFLGSENRKPAGLAEVELLFDNKDRSLPLDQDEVLVGRRIYISSSSEYLLNGRRTTRKEIEHLFMNTGIGKAAYSIMEQGRMSEILKASPEDRRALFDEAAGVSRFKAEKAETLARLSDTEQNLLRLGDILRGKKEEMEHLERQAQKTRQYLKLKEHLDRHDKNIRYLTLLDLEAKKKKVEEKLAALFKRKDDIFARISDGETRGEDLEQKNNSQIEEMHRLDREFHQAISAMESIDRNLERIRQEKEERLTKIKTQEIRKKEEEKLRTDIQAKIQASMQLELDLDSEIKVLQYSSDKLSQAITALQVEIESSVKKEEENNREIQEIEASQSALVEDLKNVTKDLILDLESRKRELEKKESYRSDLKNTIVEQLTAAVDSYQSAMNSLSAKNADEAMKHLSGVDPSSILESFQKYESIEKEFRSILFDRTGLLAKKESLDEKMEELQTRKEVLVKENSHLFEKRKMDLGGLEREKNRKVETDLQIRDFQVRRESSLEARQSIHEQLKESDTRLNYYQEEIASIRVSFDRLTSEEEAFRTERKDIEKRTAAQNDLIETIKKKITKVREEINALREKSRSDREAVEKLLPEIGEQERMTENIHVALSNLEEELYNDFQLSKTELLEGGGNGLNRQEEEAQYRRIRGEISSLGQFNALAIEELERSQESYTQLLDQQKDIEEAKKNILTMIREIDEKSRVLFVDTFERIQVNFTEIFTTLFGGGKATLTLTEPADPLNSGVDIFVQPAGKKNTSITLLSGGEQNLTAIALMFATYLVRPSPFCFLDEIDAPLDDNNVARFLRMLAGFATRSQFLVITHNKLTMSKAGGIFGVTQEEPGISKIVSVKLRDERVHAG